MWRKIHETEYYLLFLDNFEVYVTDFITIWCIYFTEKSFLANIKESNPGLSNINENELKKKGKNILENPGSLKKVAISREDTGLTVLMSVTFRYPFKLNLKLVEGSKEVFFQKVTQQLLKTVDNLHASEFKLRSLLQQKDKEIAEFKHDGGDIALRHLKTVPFNDVNHMAKHKVYEENFGLSAVPNELLIKTVKVPSAENSEIKHEAEEKPAPITSASVKTESVKTEDISIKSEPHSQSVEPQPQSPACSPAKRHRNKIKF